MHSQYLSETKKEHVDCQLTWKWLRNGGLKGETESLITACQDQAIATNYHKAKVLKQVVDPKCRLCKTEPETIHHIVSACPILANREYIERHDAVGSHLHWNICKHYNIDTCEKWYEHKPDPVTESADVTIIWNTQIQTDRCVPANKPDIIIKNKKEKTCIIIDVAIPSDYNIVQKEAEKRTKYKNLAIETQRMWGMKTRVVPIIIGATGTISKSAAKAISEIPGRHNLSALQKTVILKTAHIVRKVMD